ncbi:Retrovirus-related Pol polyprotein from transposon RE1, partial [Linum perenne]
NSGAVLDDPAPYRRLVGRLVYLCTTRPDITFTMNYLSKFVSCPIDFHMSAANRVVRYLKNAPGTGLFFFCHHFFQSVGFFRTTIGLVV